MDILTRKVKIVSIENNNYSPLFLLIFHPLWFQSPSKANQLFIKRYRKVMHTIYSSRQASRIAPKNLLLIIIHSAFSIIFFSDIFQLGAHASLKRPAALYMYQNMYVGR